MNDNKIDWSERRFQIVLKLLNKKQDGTYLDCQQIENQADELMRYLKQDEQDERLASVYKTLRSQIDAKWRDIRYKPSLRRYIDGVDDAFSFINMVLYKIEEQTIKNDPGTN